MSSCQPRHSTPKGPTICQVNENENTCQHKDAFRVYHGDNNIFLSSGPQKCVRQHPDALGGAASHVPKDYAAK